MCIRDSADIVADPQSIFTAENLFAFIGKPIGIGGIAMAGIIGIIRQSKIIRQAVGLAVSAVSYTHLHDLLEPFRSSVAFDGWEQTLRNARATLNTL